MPTAYYKCEHCGKLSNGRARKYCNRKCRDAAFYLRKKEKATMFHVTGFKTEVPQRSGKLS